MCFENRSTTTLQPHLRIIVLSPPSPSATRLNSTNHHTPPLHLHHPQNQHQRNTSYHFYSYRDDSDRKPPLMDTGPLSAARHTLGPQRRTACHSSTRHRISHLRIAEGLTLPKLRQAPTFCFPPPVFTA
ncbi:hypothetical protein GGP41_005135 [Bipolaris sorokiniana]|uniref:Uncharacterized protein n=1 Tax=Cochliobolus sativus TaxID=45130 RepID=A0A8H6DX31_COCSA|nr:hypothetical protein GGP41_005135 [Bipolaris sorokiniana]